jgi:hypothetical protein
MAPRPYNPSVLRAPALLVVGVGIAACANAPAGDVSDAQSETQHSSAVVFVERQATDGTAPAVHVGARFVQFTGLPGDALPDLLGTPHVPGNATGCAERTDATVDPDSPRAAARLLDVGPIDVRAGDRALRLEAQRFPDLWNVVSGVIYASDGELSADQWHFSAPGNAAAHIGGFDVDARAPDEIAGVTIAEQGFVAGGRVSLPHRAFGVRWSRGDHDDGVIVTFESSSTTDRPATIACNARDDGAIDIDATWADRIAALSGSGTVITFHRVRARTFAGTQADNALVVFDTSIRGSAE